MGFFLCGGHCRSSILHEVIVPELLLSVRAVVPCSFGTGLILIGVLIGAVVKSMI
jgi:hypothetical protein